MLIRIELRQARMSYQDNHMLLQEAAADLEPADPRDVHPYLTDHVRRRRRGQRHERGRAHIRLVQQTPRLLLISYQDYYLLSVSTSKQALISYQDNHMSLLTLAGTD